MRDLIISATAPIITGNFEEVKAQMLEGVKQYDVIITSETVKDGKEMAAELNKMKSLIKDVQKNNLDTLTGPIAEFKDQIKELLDIAEDARQKILQQVKVFEDQQRDLHLAAMSEYLKEQIAEQGLEEKHSAHLHCRDFVSITGLTAKGGLTKKSRDQIDLIISRALQLQAEAKLEEERKQREEDIRVEERALELEQERIAKEQTEKAQKNDFVQEPIAEQPEHVQTSPEPNMSQQDTFNMIQAPSEDVIEPIPEMKIPDQDGKAEFIAEIHILIKAPANMPTDLMAQAVFKQLESQGVTDIQNITIK